jgi:hypothetical protein
MRPSHAAIRAGAVPNPANAAPTRGRNRTPPRGVPVSGPAPYPLIEPPCPYCGTPIVRSLRAGNQQVTCGAVACRRLKNNAIKRRSFKCRYERAKQNGLCTACCRRRRQPPEPGARASLRCKKCYLAKLTNRIKYDAKLPERRRAQADALAQAERHIEDLRKKLRRPMTTPAPT